MQTLRCDEGLRPGIPVGGHLRPSLPRNPRGFGGHLTVGAGELAGAFAAMAPYFNVSQASGEPVL